MTKAPAKPDKSSSDRAPLCKICTPPRRHWGREAHVFKRVKK